MENFGLPYLVEQGNPHQHLSIQSKFQDKLAELLRFPFIGDRHISWHAKLGERMEKYSFCYREGYGFFEYNGDFHYHFLEGSHNLILYYDDRPIASLGFSIISEGILIHHIQGVFMDKVGIGHKKHKKYYPDLQYINWRESLVRAIEQIAKIQGIDWIYIQPSVYNSSTGGKTPEAEKSYDDIADLLGYDHYQHLEIIIPRKKNKNEWGEVPVNMVAYGKCIKKDA